MNARFHRDVRSTAFDFPHAGVLISQIDGHRSEGRPWLPSTDEVARGFMSASIIFDRLEHSFATIPLFSYDSGVVLRPSGVDALCLYGADGSTDQAGHCGSAILPWCSPGDLPRDPDTARPPVCGFDLPRSWRMGVAPWHVEDAGLVLEYQTHRGAGNTTPAFTGYNEVRRSSTGNATTSRC